MKNIFRNRLIALVTVVVLAFLNVARAAEPAVKIVLIGKDRDHPFRTHEYMAECALLAHCLEETPGVTTVVSNGWPKNDEVLQNVNAIVLYTCNGGDVLFAPSHRARAEELLKGGVGLSAIHWGTGAGEKVGVAWQHALGAWFSTDFSTYLVQKTELQQADPQLPICRGWKDYELRDEFYIGLKFQPDIRPVMKAKIDDKEHVLGWTYERSGNKPGRSFGFVCGHFHDNFGMQPFRQSIVNGILWTAGREIPPGGAPCDITPQNMELPPDTRPSP